MVHGKNKLFFFADYQGTKRRQYAAPPNLTLPTARHAHGRLQRHRRDDLRSADGQCGRHRPHARSRTTRFPRNRIASGLRDVDGAVARADAAQCFHQQLRRLRRTRNTTAATGISRSTTIPPRRRWSGAGTASRRMDIVAPLVLGTAGGDAFGGGNPGHAGGRVQTTAAGFTYTISPTLLVDGNVGYTRQNIGANGDPEDGFFGLDVLKIPGTNGVGPNYNGIPGFQVTGVANIGKHQHRQPVPVPRQPVHHGHQPEQDEGRAQPALRLRIRQIRAEPLPAAGRNLRHGARHVWFRRHADRAQRRRGGELQRRPGQLLGAVPAGLPVAASGKITQFQNPNALRFSDWAIYARDQWQVTRNLTVNYGCAGNTIRSSRTTITARCGTTPRPHTF